MIARSRRLPGSFRLALGLAALSCLPLHAADAPVGKWQNATLGDYRKHLLALEELTDACAKARDMKACDPTRLGLDDYVALGAGTNSERRLVRYGWLRILFSHAEEPQEATQAAKPEAKDPSESDTARPVLPTIPQLLDAARARLAADLDQSNQPPASSPSHPLERAALGQVLAGREFRNLKQSDAQDSALEQLDNWLNRLFAAVDRWRSRSPWVGRMLFGLFLLAVGVGLAWGLVQLERRWRIRLVPENDRPAQDAPSARDWQLWLADARNAAAGGLWREAIHFLYWAAIARLESKRLWPADRARTPREYLALIAADDPRRSGLISLTGSFERTWYGGRMAGESDYRRAEEFATSLMGGSFHAGATHSNGLAGGQ